jgi:hypothetical protein
MVYQVHSAGAAASVVVVALSQLLGVGGGRCAFIAYVLGVVSDSFGEGFIDGGGLGGGGLVGGFELLLLVEALLLVSALHLLFGGCGLVGLLIVGDIESLEWIGHANNQILIIPINIHSFSATLPKVVK